MIKKPAKKTSARSAKRPGKHVWSVSRIIQLLIIISSVTATYILWLDYRIHTEFEGRKWTIPARVYARPLDIYIGQIDATGQIDRSLRVNNYRPGAGMSEPGQYRRLPDGYEIYLRAFDYWDGHVAAERYRIEIADGVVSAISVPETGESVPVLRLEPELIGKIYPDHNEDRTLLGPEDVPPFLINALIAVEDRQFYRHFGLDLRGIARAFWINFTRAEVTQGGSTLTQQLVKNFFLTQERTLSRKLNEMIMAMLLERRYSKDEILLAYLNEVYLGQDGARGVHGFGGAAEFYFNKPLSELRDDQLALLAGMVRGASVYNPRRHPERALSRRNLVLQVMADQAYINAGTASELQQQPLDVPAESGGAGSKYPAFLELARRQLLVDYRPDDLKNEGLRIHTTLDPAIQDKLDVVVGKRVSSLEQQRKLKDGTLESATVVVRPVKGEVVAISAGRNPQMTGFNHALDARRPIGSLVKPFIYLTALSDPGRYNLISAVDDSAIRLKQADGSLWQPENYDKKLHGSVSLVEALVNSYNLATINTGMQTGIEKVISTLERAGVATKMNPYPSLLLGAVELSPLDVAQIYQTLANGGYRVTLNAIQEVMDSEGKPLQRHQLNIEQALDPDPVFLVNYLLSRVADMGTARQLARYPGLQLPLAVKTGTTNESRDSWFAGFGEDLLTVTWLGRDDNGPTPFTGASGAMQIWADIMSAIPVRPLNLFSPETVSWTAELGLVFEGQCIHLGKVPYTGPFPVTSPLLCKPADTSTPFRFWPFR
jgi:penicillin-binding protein 1B